MPYIIVIAQCFEDATQIAKVVQSTTGWTSGQYNIGSSKTIQVGTPTTKVKGAPKSLSGPGSISNAIILNESTDGGKYISSVQCSLTTPSTGGQSSQDVTRQITKKPLNLKTA